MDNELTLAQGELDQLWALTVDTVEQLCSVDPEDVLDFHDTLVSAADGPLVRRATAALFPGEEDKPEVLKSVEGLIGRLAQLSLKESMVRLRTRNSASDQ